MDSYIETQIDRKYLEKMQIQLEIGRIIDIDRQIDKWKETQIYRKMEYNEQFN